MVTEFSVVIPTCRRPAELAQAIASVLEQAGNWLEIIVVDDSIDQSAESVVARFADHRIRYQRNPTPSNGWVSAVRNYGIGFARGSLIHFLDDDDMAPPGHYAAMKELFESKPDVGVVFGRVAPFGDDAEKVEQEKQVFEEAARRALASRRFGPKWAFASRLFFSPTLLVCGAAVIRKSCIPSGGFDTTLKVAEDVDFYARAIQNSGTYFVDRVTLLYRIWEDSLIHTPTLGPTIIRDNYRKIHARYRRDRGGFDYLLTKALTRTLLRIV